jgi:hypothetical protein
MRLLAGLRRNNGTLYLWYALSGTQMRLLAGLRSQ